MKTHTSDRKLMRKLLGRKEPDGQGDRTAIRRLASRYLLPHWPSVLVTVVLCSLCGLGPYGYAIATSVIADRVVQVQVQTPEDLSYGANSDQSVHDHLTEQTKSTAQNQDGSAATHEAHYLASSIGSRLHLLGWIALGLIVMEIARIGFNFLGTERLIYVGQLLQFRMRQHLHDKLLALPLSYHDHHASGRLLTHLFSDVSVVRMQMKLLRTVPTSILKILVGMVLVLIVDAQLAIVILLAIPAYALFYQCFRHRLRSISTALREREGRLNGHIANRISAFVVVKAFAQEIRESIAFMRQARPLMQAWINLAVFNATFSAVCGIISGVCMTTVLWIGALRVRDGFMTLGDLLLFYWAAGNMFAPVASLTSTASGWHRLKTVAERIMRVLDEPIVLDEPKQPLKFPDHPCDLRFECVTMRYAPDRAAALTDISFTLASGERMCIMGPSGSGKSTLAKLVCRLYDPTCGTIRFDGIDLRLLCLSDLRQHVSFVCQEPVIFSGTIEDNIRYGSEDADEQTLIDAASIAQIQDFIEQLPGQYGSTTGERGLTLSGGQKQRLNLARALLPNPRVLVLDDSTSAIDASTESLILSGLCETLRHQTVVIVSHRAMFAMECDKVLMLDSGKIVQMGSPGQLLKSGGPFADIYYQQSESSRFVDECTNPPIHSLPA